MLLLRVHSEGARKAICSAKNNEGIFETVQEAIEHAAKIKVNPIMDFLLFSNALFSELLKEPAKLFKYQNSQQHS